MQLQKKLLRNIDSGDYFEGFLISTIASILIIRGYLALTGYPQVGGGEFHIAHMLWGGLFMAIAIYLMFTYMGKTIIYLSAIIGGIGFGTFIDELGKFITKDNNYFYQPTVGIIYAILVIFYLISKFTTRRHKFTPQEYVVNALEMLKEAVILDLDKAEKKQALSLLRKCNPEEPLVKALKEVVNQIEAIPVQKPGLYLKLIHFFKNLYLNVIQKKWFARLIILVFVVEAVGSLFYAFEVINILSGYFFDRTLLKITPPSYTFSDYGELFASLISGFFVVLGVIKMKFSRFSALINFKRSVLVSIFLTQFFVFLEEQFFALIGLAIDLTLILALDFMINREKEIKIESA